MNHDQLVFCLCHADERVNPREHGVKFLVVMPIDDDTGEQAGAPYISWWKYDFPPPPDKVINETWKRVKDKFEIDPFCLGLDVATRIKRDSLLSELDLVIANPLRWNEFTKEQQKELSKYRQDLLDVPQQEGFPENVVFPDKPDFIK